MTAVINAYDRGSSLGVKRTVALSDKPDTTALYDLHNRWLGGVLGGWRLALHAQVRRSGPRITSTSWSVISAAGRISPRASGTCDKLHDQLANVSPGAIQLMAELDAVHFLIIWIGRHLRGDEAPATWRRSWPGCRSRAPVPDSVLEAMTPGLVHPGQWAMTRRDTQLTWLIRFSRAWKELPADRQRLLVTDPWALKDFTETIHAPTSDSARLALLHLAHPDTFEPSVSPNHKLLMAERFAEAAGSDPDIDRRLLTARAALTPVYGEGFDWYQDPVVHLWWKNQKASGRPSCGGSNASAPSRTTPARSRRRPEWISRRRTSRVPGGSRTILRGSRRSGMHGSSDPLGGWARRRNRVRRE